MYYNKEPADYTIELKENFNDFIEDFHKEYKRQKNKVNQMSERRMRKLLATFDSRVASPYRKKSLKEKDLSLENVLKEV